MSARFRSWQRRVEIASLVCVLCVSCHAISQAQAECDGLGRCPVVLNQQKLFYLDQAAPFSAQTRAATVSDRLLTVAKDPTLPVEQIQLVERATDQVAATVISYNPTDPTAVLLTVTDTDAKAMNLDRRVLAAGQLRAIQNSIQTYRDSNQNSAVSANPKSAQTFATSANSTLRNPSATALVNQSGTAVAEPQPWHWFTQFLMLLSSLLLLGALIGFLPALMNAIAGLFLRHRIQIGDRIMVDQSEVGKVSDIHPFSTKLLADDGVSVSLIPNLALFNQYILRSTATTQLPSVDRTVQTLKFRLRVERPISQEQLASLLQAGVQRIPNLTWESLVPLTIEGQDASQNYELHLSRSLKPFAKERTAFFNDVVRVLQESCDRDGIDLYVRPIRD